LDFQRRKTFFLGLGGKQPDWLNTVQWEVLSWFFDRDVPCEPDREPFLKKAAMRLKDKHLRLTLGSYPAAEGALRLGLRKLDNHINQPTPRGETAEPKPCWWIRD